MFDAGGSEGEGGGEVDASAEALLAAVVTAATTGIDVAVALPAEALDGAALRQSVLQFERLRTQIDVAEAHALAELDRRRHTDLRLGAKTSKWLAHNAGLPAGVARAKLALANRLASDLGVVDEALAEGRLGMDHARVFAAAVNDRNAETLAEVLPVLIDAAHGMGFDTWKAHVHAMAELADPDGTHDPADDILKNRLTLSESDRFGLLRGELTGERFLTVHDTLHAVADELFAQFTRDANTSGGAITVPPRSTLLALALEETCRRALGTDPATTRAPKTEAHLTIHATPNNGEPDPVPGGSSSEPGWDLLSVHHDLLGPLPVSTVQHLLCDATFAATILDSLGVPLDQSREQRYATPEQRRALIARDGRCGFAGCDAAIGWLDVHHIDQWANHGPTDLNNLTCCQTAPSLLETARRLGASVLLDDALESPTAA